MAGHEANDARAEFSEYFAARHRIVRRTAYLLCGDWHWADDLAQATFIRVVAGWSRIREPAARDAFVRTCLVRTYLAEARRPWRRRESSYAELPEIVLDEDDPAVRVAFLHALKQVPPRQRATLVCRFYQDLDVEETARVLGCSAGTVKSQTARGMAALRAALGDAVHVETTLEARS